MSSYKDEHHSSLTSLISRSPDDDAKQANEGDDSTSRSSLNNESFKLNKQQKKCLFCILLVNFACYITYAVIAPFYTLIAHDKGMDQFHIDMIFSGYALASVLISPVWGRLVPYTGSKTMLLMGLAVNGLANVAFGLLDQIADVNTFFYCSFVLRCLEAFGTIAMVTSSYTYVIQMFPNCVGYVFGLTETAVGMGLCLGPALGGPLFALGGYSLSFFVFGSFVFICIFFCISMIDNPTDESQNDLEAQDEPINRNAPSASPRITYLGLLSIPRIQFLCFLIVLASACQNFTFPTLAAHLKSLGVSEVFVSLEFFLYSFSYMASTLFVGPLIDSHSGRHFWIIFVGNLFGSIGFLIVGPTTLARFVRSSLTFTSVGLIVMGFSLGFALIPTFDGIVHNIRLKGAPDDLHTYGKVSGLWTCMFSLGEVIGPQLSGTLMEKGGFRSASTVFALITLLVLLPLLLLFVIDWLKASRCSSSASSPFTPSLPAPSSNDSPLPNGGSFERL